MRTFESEPMQMPIPRSQSSCDRREAVAEVRLGRRADADPRARLGEQVELARVGVRRVDDRRVRAEAAGLREQLDRPQAVLGEALLDLARLLVGVHVQRQAVARPRSAPSSSSQSRGQARTEWGATPTRTPSARSASSCAR